jgi:hypothetical protein
LEVANLIDDRHQDVRITVGFGRLFKRSSLTTSKPCFGPLFVIEDLNDPLAIGHLFDVTIGFGEGDLLIDEILAALLVIHEEYSVVGMVMTRTKRAITQL